MGQPCISVHVAMTSISEDPIDNLSTFAQFEGWNLTDTKTFLWKEMIVLNKIHRSLFMIVQLNNTLTWVRVFCFAPNSRHYLDQ